MSLAINRKFVRKLIEIRPLYPLVKKYSQSADDTENILKFYTDNHNGLDKYRPLNDRDYDRFISRRAAKREPALTRLITSLAYKVGKKMLSLAEGMPNEDVFPFTRLQLETRAGDTLELKEKEMAAALQYIPSQGLPPLLDTIQQFQQRVHRPPPRPRAVIVTNGAQHGIYQCIDLFVEPGDPIITTQYSYTGFHTALRPYDPEILGIPEDADGMDPEILEQVLSTRLTQGLKMPKIMYIIPTGNNPTGTVLSEERRRRIYELACQYDFLILEDDPYMFLNYSESPVPSFLSLDACGRVVRLDSVSKVVSAGLRAAWVTAPQPLVQRLELHMQAEILHSCTLTQVILNKLLSNQASLATHLSLSRLFYRRRRDALLRSLQRAGLRRLARWDAPRAGLFVWMNVKGVDDVYDMVFDTAFNRGLMLIPGQAFLFDTSAPSRNLRLTFSKVPLEQMDAAAFTLADVIRDEQQLKRPRRLATER